MFRSGSGSERGRGCDYVDYSRRSWMDEASLPAKLPGEDNPPGYRGRELGFRPTADELHALTSQNRTSPREKPTYCLPRYCAYGSWNSCQSALVDYRPTVAWSGLLSAPRAFIQCKHRMALNPGFSYSPAAPSEGGTQTSMYTQVDYQIHRPRYQIPHDQASSWNTVRGNQPQIMSRLSIDHNQMSVSF